MTVASIFDTLNTKAHVHNRPSGPSKCVDTAFLAGCLLASVGPTHIVAVGAQGCNVDVMAANEFLRDIESIKQTAPPPRTA
jgi:hypothetical protein